MTGLKCFKVHPNDPIFRSAAGHLRIFERVADDIFLDRGTCRAEVARQIGISRGVMECYFARLRRLIWYLQERYGEDQARLGLWHEHVRLCRLIRAHQLGYYHAISPYTHTPPRDSQRWRHKRYG